MGFLARRKVLWHGRPAQLTRSVGPPNRWWDSRSIWSSFPFSFSLFILWEIGGSFRSRCSRLPSSGSRSNLHLYALVGFLSDIPRQSKRKFEHGLIIWCRTDWISTIHHQSHSTSHWKQRSSSGGLLYSISRKAVQQHESGIERSDDFEWLNMKIKPILRTDESTKILNLHFSY